MLSPPALPEAQKFHVRSTIFIQQTVHRKNEKMKIVVPFFVRETGG